MIYPMPIGQAFDSASEGAAFGLFPIMWIVVNAVWIYNLTVQTGDFAVLVLIMAVLVYLQSTSLLSWKVP